MHYLRGWLKTQQHDSVGAYREGKMALAVAIETGIPWFECLARIALAQLHATGTERHNADAQLRAAESIARRLRSPWLQFGTSVAAATVARAAGDTAAALEDLRAAFRLGREHGLGPPPAWRPEALADLCVDALEAQIETDFARALIDSGALMPKVPPLRVQQWPWRFRIATLGGFRLVRGDTPIEVSGKGPGRPLELRKALIALGRHGVRADQLADALWPHMEADYAHKSFTATLHRLRRMLDDDDAVVLSDGRLTLSRTLVWVDTWALEQLCEEFDATLRDVDVAGARVAARVRRRIAGTVSRPVPPRRISNPATSRTGNKCARMGRLARLARSWEESGAPRAAADCFQRGIDVDGLCEPLYRQLMHCYLRNGEPLEAIAIYEASGNPVRADERDALARNASVVRQPQGTRSSRHAVLKTRRRLGALGGTRGGSSSTAFRSCPIPSAQLWAVDIRAAADPASWRNFRAAHRERDFGATVLRPDHGGVDYRVEPLWLD